MTTRTTTKTIRTTTSNRLVSSAILAVILLVQLSGIAAAQKPGQPYALLVGTVFFEESGRLVRGAQVEVRQKAGKKHWESSTNVTGEFAIRVPAGKATYIIEVKFDGRQKSIKEVEVADDERVDLVVQMKAK
jgi:hypothetical protein